MPYDGQSQDVALKHPICPDRIVLKGHFPLLFRFSGGNRGCERKCKFFKDGGGREIFIINYVFTINYVLNPRVETWAQVRSCQLRKMSHTGATASSGSTLPVAAVPKTPAMLRHGLIVYQKVKVQTLIMQESAGHQPTISIPQPKLLIPSCMPSRLCWSQMIPCTVVVLHAVVYIPSNYLSGSSLNKD